MQRFAEACPLVEAHLAGRYRIRIITRDVPDPLTGDLDGAEIHIDYLVGWEDRLFLLAHLFGHTVQWNTSPRALEIGQQRVPPVDPSLLPAILDYEREAAAYALGMLHEAGICDLDQWMADYTACDMAYLLHFYRTGEKRPFRSFWRENAEPIQPRPVPPFVPAKKRFRVADGIVI